MANVPRSGSRRLRDSWPDSRRTFNTSNVWPRRRWNGWVTVAEPKERLASSAVRWVCGDAQPSLPAPWLWQPDAANIAGPIASLQQFTAQSGDDGRGFHLRIFDRLSIRSRRSLVAHDVQQRSGQIGFGRCVFEQPTGVGRAGVGTGRLLALRFVQQKASPLGCVRALILSAPPKGCRRTRSSIVVVPSFSIHLLLCSAGFRQPPRSYGEIRLLRGRRPVVVASFGSTARADPAGPACTGITFRSVLRFASGFFPTRPHGARASVSRRRRLRAVASGSRLLPSRPAKDFHLQSSAHARHTRSGYALPSLSPRRRILILIVARFSSRLSRRTKSRA